MTTRKAAGAGTWQAWAALTCAALGGAGCATPGVLHVYSVASPNAASVHDTGVERAMDVASFLEPEERLTGFAYDPFTDHFFLRLAPGNAIRVVDRPARKVKREFTIDGAPTAGGGDLAIKPRTGHVFLVHPTEPRVMETTRLGRLVRNFALEGLAAPARAIAYDAAQDRLLVLEAGSGAGVGAFDLEGRRRGAAITLERAVAGSLAFDSEAREFYAPLADAGGGAIGVFDERGRYLRSVGTSGAFVDVGPRSFIRVF